ncbi:hypothetical protein PIB30_039111 [Stylosanthes scabra]|uniref:NAC domain-containing protein n=1 Tax=Stylosanthes scabra TaxID=79078 RepID=A0ABU6QDX3_9FABA|nr:hypothetical protein [Stylosanthes scabra]
MADNFPVGYRFLPKEEELLTYYLKNKIEGNDSLINNTISQIHLYSFDPWDLPEHSKVKSDDSEWFFFTELNYTTEKNNRCVRKTNGGYWKITGKERQIKTMATDTLIGTKKTLVFYNNRPDSVKTNWVMHEYHAPNHKTMVLCRVTNNPEKKEKKAKRKANNLLEEEVTQTKKKASNLIEEEVTRGEDEPVSEITSHLTQETTPEDTRIQDNAVDQIPSLVPQSPAATATATSPASCSGNENNNAGSLPLQAILERDAFFNSMYSSVDVCPGTGFLYSEFLNSLLAGDDHWATSDSP